MKTPASEIADRLSILRLKNQRLPHNSEVIREECAYAQAFIEEELPWSWIERLEEVNGAIWDLESDIRRGMEGELGLKEVGRRALAIRDLNSKRIAIKNELAGSLGGFKEVKGNHASAQC